MDLEIKVRLNNVFLRYWTKTCVVQGCFFLCGLTCGCCDLKDNLPMPIYEAAKRCVEAFRLKDEDLMKDEIATFIQYQINMHVYNRLLDAWQVSLANLKKNRTTHVAKGLERYDQQLILEAEARMWSWSSLHLRLLEKPTLDFYSCHANTMRKSSKIF